MQKSNEYPIHLATSSMDKFGEMKIILNKYKIDLKVSAIKGEEIQSFSPLKVAESAAVNIAKTFKDRFLVEDTALYVHSLYGFPAAYASFVSKTLGPGAILTLLEGREDAQAEFHSALVYGSNGKIRKTFVGVCEGEISRNIKGDGGFGFDSIFIPKGHKETFAEMSLIEKNKVSHRAKAVRTFAEWFNSNKQ